MYRLFDVKILLSLFATFSGAVFLAQWLIFHPTGIKDTWSLITSSVTYCSVAIAILGQTPLFPRFCRLPLVNAFLPDLDGEWEGRLSSNWETIRERAGLPAPAQPTGPINVRIRIVSRLFFIRINLESDNQYSTSKTIFVDITKDPQDGDVRLNYMYDNTTKQPQASDSQRHYGAAYLDLKKNSSGKPYLDGVYWTNRNWHNALNTAGMIVLTKQ